jgi:hypothetical protein
MALERQIQLHLITLLQRLRQAKHHEMVPATPENQLPVWREVEAVLMGIRHAALSPVDRMQFDRCDLR